MESQMPPGRIVLRPFGSPLPLGLFSFGVGMLLLAAETAGWVPRGQTMQVGILIASFVFPLEGAAAIIAFLARDTLAATVLGLFATSWLCSGLILISRRPAPPASRSPSTCSPSPCRSGRSGWWRSPASRCPA
jgi:succinate-acetate transporter protein